LRSIRVPAAASVPAVPLVVRW